MSEELNLTPWQTLAFFASVIKSGEPWTGTCQKAYDEAMVALCASPPPPEDVRRMREALEVIAHRYHDLGPRDFAALARVTAKIALAEKETER